LSDLQREKVLSDLESSGGKAPRSIIAYHAKLKQAELDPILDELEHEGVIQRTRLKISSGGPPGEIISLKK
jgi:hypothetical protein